jgi:hypothetical protein
MTRQISRIVLEAISIGIITLTINKCIGYITENVYLNIFLSGALIHLIFEYFGLNLYWCKTNF